MEKINVIWAFTAVLLLTAQHCQLHDVQRVPDIKGNNDNLLVHLISSLVKHTEKIKDLEHKLSKQQDTRDEELKKVMYGHAKKIEEFENKLKMQEEKHNEELKLQLEEKHSKKIKDLENQLHRQGKKHKELEQIVNALEDRHTEKFRHLDERVEDDIKKLKSDQADDKKQHSEELKMVKDSLATKQPISPVVGFHVALDRQQSSGREVAFNRILSNYGNSWNRTTHKFTVPTKGLYFLILTVMNDHRSTAWALLMRGSTKLLISRADGGHRYNVGTTSTVLMLNAGEHIYAQYGGGTLHSNIDLYTHLAGFLIQRMD